MESKLLNFPDAMWLARTITKYLDPETIKDMTGFTFLDEIVAKITPEEFLIAIKLFTRKDVKEIEKLTGDEFVVIFIKGCIANDLLTLLKTYKSIGL